MQVKRLGDIYLVRLEPEEEVISRLRQFADAYRIGFGALRATGALASITLGYYDAESMSDRHQRLEEPVEVLTLNGDIVTGKDGESSVRAYVTVGRSDYTTRGGRLVEATVGPALEVVVETAPGRVRRRYDPDAGRDLWDLTAMDTLTL